MTQALTGESSLPLGATNITWKRSSKEAACSASTRWAAMRTASRQRARTYAWTAVAQRTLRIAERMHADGPTLEPGRDLPVAVRARAAGGEQ